MPSIKRSSKQAARDRAALKRLRKAGIFRGKIDLRKPPSKAALKKIAELKAKSARKPQPPANKVPGATIRRDTLTHAQLKDIAKPSHKLTTYALPFLRKGQQEPEWRRFTHDGLKKFLAEYKADDPDGAAEWKSYAVRERWTFDTAREVISERKEVNVYFSGVRIDEPNGKIVRRVKPKYSKTKEAKRKRDRRSKGKRN